VAAETPHLIKKAYIDPATGMIPFQARQLAFGIGSTRRSSTRPRS